MEWHLFDWIVIGVYFLIMLLIGVFFSKRTKSTDDYFRAGGRVPAIVTAASIYATAFSSISFMAIPASVYNNGWLLGMAPFGIILMVVWAAQVFVPFFRRINASTAYEYLGRRFNNAFRLIGSLTFILFHIVRMAIVLYLPTLALQEVLKGLNPALVTLIVAIFCVAYTSIGGMEAVLWSDAIQTLVLILGAFLLIIVGFASAPDIPSAFKILSDDGKIIGPTFFSLDLATSSIWVIIIGGFFNSIYQYVGSQDIVQRYSTNKTEAESKKSLFMNIPLALTSVVIFVGMGSALWIFFHTRAALPENINGNAILPYFVINYLPVGISGLVLAALFAAAQSTVSSSLNSVSTCMTADILEQVSPNMPDKSKLTFARLSSWIVGIVSTLLAIYFIYNGQGDMFLYFNAVTGLLGGPIAGIFLAGIFFKRVDSRAVWCGFIVSIIVAFYISDPAGMLTKFIPGYTKPQIFEFIISFLIIGTNVVVSVLASFIFGKPAAERITGLTYEIVKEKR